MSIPNLINKIKGNIAIDKTSIMYLFIVMGVGVSAFGLGRLSVDSSNSDTNPTRILNTEDYTSQALSYNTKNVSPSLGSNVGLEKKYVASKNGKLYYSVGCAGAKRIAEKNKVWFATSVTAEKSGYSPSPSCK